MFLAPQLFAYYPDLADARVKSALAIVHQRYSTNTFPSWRLAQPFRMIAHNGEINTLRGNAQPPCGPASRTMASPAFGDDLSDLFPILEPGGSDSACFDNAHGTAGPRRPELPHAMMMMIPEAFGPQYHIIDRQAGVLRVPRRDHGAVGRPGGDGLHRRPPGRRHAGPQRPAALPLRGDHRRPGGPGQRGGRDRVPARADPAERPSSAGPHVPGRYRRGPDRRRQRDQGQDRPAEALSPLAGGEPHRAARAVPAAEAVADRSARRSPSGCGPSATPAKSCR